MAGVKKGILTPPKERWRHLGEFKRPIWKRERKAAKKIAQIEASSVLETHVDKSY